MLNAKAFANAAATVMAVWVLACALLSFLAPDLLFTVAQSWMHTINLESVKTTLNPNLGFLLWGLITATGLTWLTTYSFAKLYNRFTKK
ncbi:MAG: DUF5676 family membrane protein [Candidatus Curtissbacteria bacterium]|nr:DUF5676 family membrane protein [Candidatus Curtissbacteria bacterium]